MATLEDDEILALLKKLAGSRGGDINDFDQEYVEPTANENYGYVNKPGALSFLGMAPVPGAKMAAAAVNSGINMGNNQAIRRAREALGLPNQKPSIAKDMISSPKDGKIADVQIADQSYPVGFEAQDKDKKTTLTPNEARMRGMMNGGMTEKSAPASPTKKEGLFGKVKDAVFGGKKDEMDDETKSLHNGLGITVDDTGNFRHIDDPDLPTRQMANVNYDLDGKGRSEIPSSGIGNKVSDVVTDILGAGYGVNVTSGQEPEGRSPVGTQYRHPLGFAADLQITDPSGRKLSLDNPEDKAAIENVAQGMAARYNANFGMGPEYMGDNTMHIDTMDLNKYRGGAQWASTGKEWAGTLDQARATGVMPAQYYDVANPPVPGQRPEEPSNLIAEQDEQPQSPSQESLGFMGRPTPQEKESSPVPSYDSLMGEQSTGRASVNPDRFKNVTDEEKSLMGMTLAGEIDPTKTDLSTEAGRREAMGVLSTIENRAPQYGGIEGAISAPKQYSTWNNDAAANTAVSNYNGNKSTYDTLVSDFMSNPENNLGFTSYHANTVNPGWSGAMQNKETIGPHTFGFLGDQTTKEPVSTPTPHTVFNTSASYAPHMNGMVSEVNSNRFAETSKPKSTPEPTTETRQSSSGFAGGSGGSSFGGSGTTRSGMTGTSNNAGKDKDDNISGGFSGGRSY